MKIYREEYKHTGTEQPWIIYNYCSIPGEILCVYGYRCPCGRLAQPIWANQQAARFAFEKHRDRARMREQL